MIVLDTHALIWWVAAPERLGRLAMEAISAAESKGIIYVPTIATWEIAMLVRHGRLSLSEDLGRWIDTCERIPSLRFVPLTNAIALASVDLPSSFQDPVDRIIVATARTLSAPLITADTKIQSSGLVETIWA